MWQSQPQRWQNQRPLWQKQHRRRLRLLRQDRLLRQAILARRMQNLSRSQPRNRFRPTEAHDLRLHQLLQVKHDLSQRLLLTQLVRHL